MSARRPYRTNNNLSFDNDVLAFDGVYAGHGSLMQVDDRRAKQATEDAIIRNITN